MSEGAVAERYAQALFELGTEAGQLSQLSEKLQAFADVYTGSKDLRAALDNPKASAAEKAALIIGLAGKLGVPPIGQKGLGLIGRRRRMSAIAAIARRLTELADENAGVVRASVVTAKPMGEAFYTALSQKLSSSTGKKVVLARSTNPDLIAGAITRVGDIEVDGSVRGQLDELKRSLHGALTESL